jgi:hypothetical protein
MMIPRRPPWGEQERVADWVLKNRRHALLRAMGLEEDPDGSIYSFLDADPEPSEQEQAVEAAKRGKPKRLADLIERSANEPESKISPEALRLAAEFLKGERNLKTGRSKADKQQQRGRPRMSALERAQRTPTYDAAKYYVPAVEQVLREEYPDQSRRDHHDCALHIVERMSGVSATTLAYYLNRSRRGAHRI